MLITLKFSVVAMKSRTFSGFSYSADGQGVQELGGSTARQRAQAGQWKYCIAWTSCSVCKCGLAGGGRDCYFPGVQTFFHGFVVFLGSSMKFMKSVRSPFHDGCLGTGYAISLQAVRKKLYCVLFVLHIHYYY